MNWFLEHRPGYVVLDSYPEEIPFETTEELLNIERVKQAKQWPGFSHFAIDENYLIAVYTGDPRWWVVGVLGDPESVDLPQWRKRDC